MKKIFSTFGYLIIILVVAQLGATYYVSGVVEEKFRKMEHFLNDNQLISSEIVSYKKGLFKSEAITNVKFKLLDSINLVQIKHTILNGPLVITGDKEKPVEFQLAVIKSHPIEMLDSVSFPFNIRTIFNYQGEAESGIEGKIFEIKHNQLQIIGSEWQSSAQITKDRLAFKGHTVFPHIDIRYMGLNLEVKDLKISFDQKRSTFGNWLGDVTFSLGNILQKEQNLEVANFQFKEKSVLQENILNIDFGIDLEKVELQGLIYGPLHIKILAENIDAKALQEISQGKIFTQEKQEENFREFLIRRPKLTIAKSYLTLPQGSIQINAELSIGGPDITIPLKKEAIEQTIDGQISLVAPKAIVEQAVTMGLLREIEKQPDYQKMDPKKKQKELERQVNLKLQKLIQEGILVEKPENYEINFLIIKGKWTANGKPVALPVS